MQQRVYFARISPLTSSAIPTIHPKESLGERPRKKESIMARIASNVTELIG
jgi:hypothetical protein